MVRLLGGARREDGRRDKESQGQEENLSSVIKEKNEERKKEGNQRLKKGNISSLIEKNKEKGKILDGGSETESNGSEGQSPREKKAQR